MKFISYLILIIFSIFLSGCESNKDSVVSTDDSSKISSDSPKHLLEVEMDFLDLDDVFVANKEIDGSVGGQITLDTVFTEPDGNLISIQASLTIKPNSFNGTKNITIRPDPLSGSIRFSPEMTFDLPLELDLKYTGINLTRLGFDSNAKTDFVYQANDGTTQFILYDECKIKWHEQEIKVKKAELPHFSRYVFVRKSL